MEVLNNIWLALNTPNENLVNIIVAIFIITTEAPLSFYLITTVFNISCNKKQRNIYIFITAFMAVLGLFITPWPFIIILNYLSAFLILYYIFKAGFVKALIASLAPSIVFNLIGALLTNPYLTIFNISYEEISTIPIQRIPFSIIMYFIIYLCISLFKSRNIKIKILDNFDKKSKIIIITNFIFSFLYIIFQSILIINYIDILPMIYTIFNFICLMFYFGISFFSLAKVMSLNATSQRLESVEEYNKTLHILHDNVRGFKHDFDNIVATIGGYVKTNDMNGLEKYYSQLEEDCKKVNNLYLLNPDIINNPGIYSLLTTKYSEANEKGITVNLSFLLDLNELNMKIYDFTRILGILLDNAIDASENSEEKLLTIEFRNDSKNNRNIVLIENTYKDKNVDIENIFNKGVSGKENHTGLGLWEVKQILKKNNNVNLHTTKNEQYFSQQLEIYY